MFQRKQNMWSTFTLYWVSLLSVCFWSQVQAQVGLFREGFTDILIRGPVWQYNIRWGYNEAYADPQSTPSQNLNEYICEYIRVGFTTNAKLQSVSVECTVYKVDPTSFEVTTKLRMTNAQLSASGLPTTFGGLNEIVEQMLGQYYSIDRDFVYNAHVLVVGFLHGSFYYKRISPQAVYAAWSNETSSFLTQLNDDICAMVRLLGGADGQFRQIKYDCEIVRGGIPEAFEVSTKVSMLATELERLGLACDPTTFALLLQNKITYRAMNTPSLFYKPIVNDPDLKSEIYHYLLHGRITERGVPISFPSSYEAERSNELRTFFNKVCLIVKQNICTRWDMAPNFECKAKLQSYNLDNMMYTSVVKLYPPYFSVFGLTVLAEQIQIALADMIHSGYLSNEHFTYNPQITKPDITFTRISFQLYGRITAVDGALNPDAIHDEICSKVQSHTELRRIVRPYSSWCSLVQFETFSLQMQIELTVSVGQKGYRYMTTNAMLIPSALDDLGARGAFSDSRTGYIYNARVISLGIHLEDEIPTSENTIHEDDYVVFSIQNINVSVSNTADEREMFRYVHQSHCNNLLTHVLGHGVSLAAVARCTVLKFDPVGRLVKSRILISHHDMASMNLMPEDITIE